ncbi:hypothetical protein cypCar_00019352 [Cyprinus carpio]|nr:hypothetical protein cypCar_00019352 [Cyprinus carpio]
MTLASPWVSCFQINFLNESNECSSEEDLLDLCSSLRDSEYFRDLQLGSTEPPDKQLLVLTSPVSDKGTAPFVPPASTPESRSRQSSTEFDTRQHFQTDNTVISTGGEAMDRLVAIRNSEFQDYPESEQDEDSDTDNFPTLVRSMSTSRRHSWEVPVSPIDLGRRFSLDTNGIDSDGEREVHCLAKCPDLPSSSFSESSVEETTGAVESESPKTPQPPTPAKTVYSRSEILATDEKSQADRVSRILETSKQAAREAGEEQESEEGLQSVEGRTHV